MTDTTTEAPKFKATVLRDFTDAGTETNYAKDQEVQLTAGELLNLSLAGLVEKVADAQPDEGKTKGKATNA
ncbi:hypothetical protein ACQR50_09250 [Sphingomonas sp. Xoc002]|uniref:hypothetical protein n=1 Tax=Sphingomonas sp. Xoc002 TaxID=2837624 RepID=UPI003D18034D